MRLVLKLAAGFALVVFCCAVAGVSTRQFPFERNTQPSTSAAPDRSGLNGGIEQYGVSGPGFSYGSPAPAESAFRTEASTGKFGRPPDGEFFEYRALVPFDLFERPPPA